MSRNVRRRQSRGSLLAAAVFAAVVALLGVAAMWPIYATPRIWAVTGIGAGLALAVVWLGARLRWGALTIVALVVAFALAVLPVAVPSAFGSGIARIMRAEVDALAAVALGWKQILTLTLPLGSYQNVLVPALVVSMVASAAGVALVFQGGRLLPLAAFPALLPVLFGTFFGSSQVSEPLQLGPVPIVAPRETALWVLAFTAVAVWIGWVSGAERRAAFRRGRTSVTADSDIRALQRGAFTRVGASGLTLLIALGAGAASGHLMDPDQRQVPRDRIDPEIVVRQQVSPLASYRNWKRNEAYNSVLFTVSGQVLPTALRIAVLDHFDGVDFTLGPPEEAGRFTRLPSARASGNAAPVRIGIESGYHGVWAPIADLGSTPEFFGPRSEQLEDSFFLNEGAGAAVIVPTTRGLTTGDGYEALMSTEPPPELHAGPVSPDPLVDLSRYPQLQRWLELQHLSPSASGLEDAIERLRSRGYLSHSLSDDAEHTQWLEALQSRSAVRFIPSAGGHSAGRVEELFAQLADQQDTAGENAEQADLVAGIGDDEQFATAAALIARALGYDSRVVVGVRLGTSEDDAQVPIPACTGQCEGRHMSAWVEVQGADEQWVPMAATPQIEIPPTLIEQGEQLPEFSTQPEERDAAESDPPVGETERESAEGSKTDDPEEPGNLLLRTVAFSLAALLLIGIPIVFLPVAKRVRTWRRRSRRPAELSVLNAWAELLDRYIDAGAPAPSGGSRTDISLAMGVAGGEQLAGAVDRAVFAPEGVTDTDADELWHAVDSDRRRRRKEMGVGRRIAAAYSLRSLGIRPRGRRGGTRDR